MCPRLLFQEVMIAFMEGEAEAVDTQYMKSTYIPYIVVIP